MRFGVFAIFSLSFVVKVVNSFSLNAPFYEGGTA